MTKGRKQLILKTWAISDHRTPSDILNDSFSQVEQKHICSSTNFCSTRMKKRKFV